MRSLEICSLGPATERHLNSYVRRTRGSVSSTCVALDCLHVQTIGTAGVRVTAAQQILSELFVSKLFGGTE